MFVCVFMIGFVNGPVHGCFVNGLASLNIAKSMSPKTNTIHTLIASLDTKTGVLTDQKWQSRNRV